MHRLAKPWYRLRAVRVFVDRTDLGASPSLWPTIQSALVSSRCLIVVGSPAAAAKPKWIDQEIRAWLAAGNPASRILIVLASGTIAWDGDAAEFDWRQTDALPPSLRGVFSSEPLWVDLCFARGPEQMTLRHPEFFAAIARLSAPVRGLEPATLLSADYREHRRALQLAWSAVILLALLATVALVLYFRAERARGEAERQTAIAATRLADSRVAQMRFGTLSGQFELAWAGLGGADAAEDTRLKVARWAVELHRAYPTRTVKKFVERGISALTVHPKSGELVGLDDAVFAGGRPRFVMIDPSGPSVLRSVAAPGHPDRIVAGADSHVFYATGGGRLTRLSLAESEPVLQELVLEPSLDDLAWFAETSVGIGLRGGELFAISVESIDVRRASLGRVGEPTVLLRSPDGKLLAVASQRTANAKLNDTAAHGDVRPIELHEGKPRLLPAVSPAGRLTGSLTTGWLDEHDHLHIRQVDDGRTVETRAIEYKPWLGQVLALPAGVLVQEVGDTSQETVASVALLDPTTGMDLISPFISEDPIWAIAVDEARKRLYLAGLDGWFLDVDTSVARVQARALPDEVEKPIVVLDADHIVVGRGDLERTTVEIDLASLKAHLAVARFPVVHHELPDGGYISWHDCPFHGAVSPDFSRIAVKGSDFWIAELSEGERSDARAGRLDLPAVCQRVIAANTGEIWSPSGVEPPLAMRWASNKLLLVHDFHGGARRIDVEAKKHEKILQPEMVVSLSQLGPVRFSMRSGTVYEVGGDGQATKFGALPNLVALYPLEPDVFVAAMTRPDRTAFIVRHQGVLEEVAAIPQTGLPVDARLVGDRVVILYSKSVRVYSHLPAL